MAVTQVGALEAFNSTQSGGPIGSSAQAAAEFIVDDSTPIFVVTNSASFDYDGTSGQTPSAPESVGRFWEGITEPETLLPTANQNAHGDAEYEEGGIGVDEGVVLSTGWVTDSDSSHGSSIPTGQGVGVEGPNNGEPISGGANEGEVSLVMLEGVDEDFEDTVFPDDASNGGDAAAIQFTVAVEQPGYLEITTVFASDEYPWWLADEEEAEKAYNDSFCVFVGMNNLAEINLQGALQSFTLYDLSECDKLFVENQIAPSPQALNHSKHAVDSGALYYDHEFAGFTIPLTWTVRLDVGTYDIKIVVQDVEDTDVDSALFIPENGIILNTDAVVPGDCNLDGEVDDDDLDIVLTHWNQSVAPWSNGDCDGSGHVNQGDLDLVLLNWEFYEWKADFDRDGDVDDHDKDILDDYFGMTECASKFQGDADGDGAVDGDDEDLWELEDGSAWYGQ